ncbi:hypothetical protein C4D60_Mb00t14770 [Musa balbisiana]|nr:hypothetical protein C4D60_Mb00t14770 [Musa balbisiana]
MWFNSMQSEEPYQGLTCRDPLEREAVDFGERRTRCAGLSSARAVRQVWVRSRNERNPSCLVATIECGTPRNRLPVISRRKVGMTSSNPPLIALGDTTCYKGRDKGFAIPRGMSRRLIGSGLVKGTHRSRSESESS